ncbi:MAG: hypothetical protein IBX71_10745, partial [Candidatus Desulforudis sp.]|nr:hypothetical protein [Desulforudis sp.]
MRDRLPLHLGVLAFHRRTPLYVAVDAAKRLLDAFRRDQQPTVEAKVETIDDTRQSEKMRILKLNPLGLVGVTA